MPYFRLWVHCVWATKNRNPFLNSQIRYLVHEHIKDYARSKNIYLDHINGHHDHVHCLISLNSDQNIETCINLLKGESSHWINAQKLLSSHFNWQNEYFAVSVSQSQVPTLRKYIAKQELHHAKKTFQQEYDEFMQKYEFEKTEAKKG